MLLARVGFRGWHAVNIIPVPVKHTLEVLMILLAEEGYGFAFPSCACSASNAMFERVSVLGDIIIVDVCHAFNV